MASAILLQQLPSSRFYYLAFSVFLQILEPFTFFALAFPGFNFYTHSFYRLHRSPEVFFTFPLVSFNRNGRLQFSVSLHWPILHVSGSGPFLDGADFHYPGFLVPSRKG